MTDTKLKEKFIEILKFNMLEPTIDPEDGNFEDHLSIQLWKFFANELAKARAEDRRRIVEIVEGKKKKRQIPLNEKVMDRVYDCDVAAYNQGIDDVIALLRAKLTKKD